MAFSIHKRLWIFCYVRRNRLTVYASRRTISNFSASNFHDCVFKVMVVSRKAHFCVVASPACRFIADSSQRHFLLNKRKIYRTYYADFEWVFDVFHHKRVDSTWPKPNYDIGQQSALDVSVSDKIVTSFLDEFLHITAQKRMVDVIPCTFSKSYYELFWYIILNRCIARHVLLVLNFLCTVYIQTHVVALIWKN